MRDLRSTVWDTQRFAVLPPKLVRRMRNRSEPRVLVVSLPKAGTHLIERAILLHTPLYRALLPTLNEENVKERGGLSPVLRSRRPGQVLVSHLPYRDEWHDLLRRSGIMTVLMKRDPRDIVVSNMFYIRKRSDHRSHELLERQISDKERIRLLIRGDSLHGLRGIDSVLSRFEGWLEAANVVASYEDLIGPKGGGNAEQQHAAITAIYQRIGLELPASAASNTAAGLFSSASPTYRKGLIGQWQDHFDLDLSGEFDRVAGSLAAKYGYQSQA